MVSSKHEWKKKITISHFRILSPTSDGQCAPPRFPSPFSHNSFRKFHTLSSSQRSFSTSIFTCGKALAKTTAIESQFNRARPKTVSFSIFEKKSVIVPAYFANPAWSLFSAGLCCYCHISQGSLSLSGCSFSYRYVHMTRARDVAGAWSSQGAASMCATGSRTILWPSGRDRCITSGAGIDPTRANGRRNAPGRRCHDGPTSPGCWGFLRNVSKSVLEAELLVFRERHLATT